MKYLLILLINVCFTACVIAKPIVIAHRGASGYLPEHTLEALILAYAQGADYIEQDLVLSKDGVPIVLHDIHLETVTDVEQKYPERKRNDNRYYAIDFTLAELKTLRVHERTDKKGKQVFKNRFQGQSQFTIATFEEQIQLISQLNRQLNRDTGIYPEIKFPAWHKNQGLDITLIVLNILRKYDLDDPLKKVFVQCFNFAEIKRLKHELKAKVKLIQLIGEDEWQESPTQFSKLKTATGLAELAKLVHGIGPWMPQIVNPTTFAPSELVIQAKKLGLKIHPYTFRTDLLPENQNQQQVLDLLFQSLKVDGVFTDFTDVVVEYLKTENNS